MRMLQWAVLLLLFVAVLFPVWLMVANSLSPIKGFLRNPPRLLPSSWTLDHYRRIFALDYLSRWAINTGIVAGFRIVCGVIINGAAGYVFCFNRAKWLTIIFWALMAPIFVSGYVLLISRIRLVSMVGLDGLPAVISMSLFWPVGIFLFRNYFRRIPREIVESARMDGAGEWRVLLQIVLPMSKPMVGAAVVFLGMGALSGYVWQMLNLQAIEIRTYIVGLMGTAMQALAVKNIGQDLAIGVMLFLPYLVLFSVSSRYFIKGLSAGAVKE